MRRLPASLAAVALAVLPALPARAEPKVMVIGAVAETYVPFQLTINEGDTLVLVNLENSPHDVVSVDWADGLPLFQSDIVGLGGTSEVRRVNTLLASAYPFYCSVHDTMTGLLFVEPAEQ